MISLIVPVYNEEKNISIFLNRVVPIISKIDKYEIIFCLDPSHDNTEQIIEKEINSNKNIKLIKFSRRFGQSNCIFAGIKNSSGEKCVIIDVDLQDPPELIEEMNNKIKEGYDCVYAQRIKREGESFIRIFLTSLYYFLINKFSGHSIPKNAGEFRMFSKKIILEIKSLNERNFFLRGITPMIGYRHIGIQFVRSARKIGSSKYNIGSISGAITGLISFSGIIKKLIFLFIIFNILILLKNIIFFENFQFIYSNIVIIFFSLISFVIIELLNNISDTTMNRKAYIIDKKVNFK